jgi:hypothetical protein
MAWQILMQAWLCFLKQIDLVDFFPLDDAGRANARGSSYLFCLVIVDIDGVKTFFLGSAYQGALTIPARDPPSMVSDLYAGITTNALSSYLGYLDH